ncbi:hypothetical protein IFM12275_24400 [Nocardia sputorum]|uniref:hypothetical protein n=1 Tax=Nocardia sputorum TaxID=2984338 RepID=UPI002490F483|nr:hypothetical protein [Nocardia sputorum]BDT92464.1 hypothetical protein IFM12275_24400 [Nocardia sputorum]
MVSWDIDPHRSGLLLLHPRCPTGKEARPVSEDHQIARRLNVLADLCRDRAIPVITTSRTLCPDHGLRVELGDIRTPLPRDGVFGWVGLDRVMCSFGLHTVIIGGLGMKACYESVLRMAADRGHRAVLLATDCTILPDGSGWNRRSPSLTRDTELSPRAFPFAEVTNYLDVTERLMIMPKVAHSQVAAEDAARVGVDGLTIGSPADRLGMRKPE